MLRWKAYGAASLVLVLIGLSGCAAFIKDPDPQEYMAPVKVGMARAEVEDKLGPPDGNWGPWYSVCTEYAFKKHGTDRWSVYYNNQSRVVYTEHAGCNLERAKQVGLR
ncbi:hypothetical protein AWB76_01802 [Caballeronia temeraria]|uniref:Lipoprotein SmpA/OmlA domain-containing protein n=1 Tax=Caballeronia temeraria TaxID=1777137 RepID=A0A158A5F2_9BURK|nr:hypothetical protein [Caballeronia temeraria]SAK53062.1 hypothetical protein AWB76_01802 [Caballeronia temeraria]